MHNKVVKNVSIILFCSVIAKVLSYAWEAILAYYLGASDQADAIYMTTSVFGILYPILDLGIWKVFLPTYKTKLVKGEDKKAEQIANIAVTFFFLLSVALVLFLIFCARPLVAIMAPGFDAEKKAFTIEYLRISAPTYLLMATASVIGAMLQSREKFFGSQIREIGTHASKIIYIFICYRFLGIYAAVTAMIVGGIFRLLIQLPFISWKWKYKPNFHFRNEDVVPMIKGLPSVAVTAAIAHINGLVDRVVASNAASGSVACLNYGHKLMSVFSGMVSTAIGTAVYPTMIQYITEKKTDKLKDLLINVINALGFIIFPISCFCMLFSEELVTVAFQRGAFDVAATKVTAGVFMGYCLGMLFLGISTTVTNVFYGYGDTKITMYISLIGITINVGLDLLFIKFWGVTGLAFATSISAIISLSIRFVLLRKYLKIGYKQIIIEYIKILVLSVISCGVPFVIFSFLCRINVYFSLIISVIICGILYIGLAHLFKIKAFDFVCTLIGKRFGRKKIS
ncbi:MAG: murein biosynthesis integral membrane protein MurJ [Saccharofermentans sp.]|nr:murein biosynthesis integral membrane protein MurJ [Saccharofermentans sp.]